MPGRAPRSPGQGWRATAIFNRHPSFEAGAAPDRQGWLQSPEALLRHGYAVLGSLTLCHEGREPVVACAR